MLDPLRLLGTVLSIVLAAALAFGQSGEHSGRFGFGVKGSLLGGGVEAAVRVSHRTNVRAGFNVFRYSHNFVEDAVAWNGRLSFETIEAHYDIFPHADRFHMSPGILIYAGTPITATSAFAGNQILGLAAAPGVVSDPSAPLNGNGKIRFDKVAPMFTVGWGNLVSRKALQHFSFPLELGVAFTGPPRAKLNVAGNVCEPTPAGPSYCSSITSDPTFQANVVSQQNDINNSMRFLKVYPIISFGVGYRF